MPANKDEQLVRWVVKDPMSITVTMYEEDFQDHILVRHGIMGKNETAIKETVEDPDRIYHDKEDVKRRVYLRSSTSATYSKNNLSTKVIVEDTSHVWTDARVVTAFPVKREGESDVRQIYKRPDES